MDRENPKFQATYFQASREETEWQKTSALSIVSAPFLTSHPLPRDLVLTHLLPGNTFGGMHRSEPLEKLCSWNQLRKEAGPGYV